MQTTPTANAESCRFVAIGLLLGLTTLGGCFRGVDNQPLDAMRAQNNLVDLQRYQRMAPQLEKPLTLREAIELALDHNLDIYVAQQERAFHEELAGRARLKMLPGMVANAQVARRSEYIASSSVSVLSGTQSLEPSYSAEKSIEKFDIGVVWDLLDFGVSYLRSRQADDRTRIAAQRLRRVRQQMALEVTEAYWRAAAAREAAAVARQVERLLDASSTTIDKQLTEQTISRVDALKRQAPLLEHQLTVHQYQQAYQQAMAELARLIGLPPDSQIELAKVDFDQPLPQLSVDFEAMETEALHSRPELFEQDLHQRISRHDARVALVQMFPSPSLFWRYESDQNKLLYINDWHTVGLRATWDLLSIPGKLKQHDAAKAQAEVIGRRRLALAVGVLTQLHLAAIEHTQARQYLGLTGRIAAKRTELIEALANAAEQGDQSTGQSLEDRLKHLTARARYLMSYARTMGARARLFYAAGREPADWPMESLDAPVAPGNTNTPASTDAPDATQPTSTTPTSLDKPPRLSPTADEHAKLDQAHQDLAIN